MTQLLLQGLRLKSHMTFANFYPGSNQLLVDYLQNRALNEAVYLWGGAGNGLTHLLQALCADRMAKGQTVMYLPLKQAQEYSPEILADIQGLNVLCLDNLEAVLGQDPWEEALFHAYNQARESGCLWLTAANTSVRGLKIHLADLHSRLSWGQTFQVQTLSEEERMQALQLRAKERGMILTQELLQFLLNHHERHLGALLNLLNKLDEASLAQQKRLTIPFAKEILAQEK